MQDSAPILLHGLPPPPAAYVYNVQSVPPSRNKESPPPVKMAGQEHPSL